MKKVFFDIGTNYFQGYDQLSQSLGIDASWHKVFVEPNPDFRNDPNCMARIASIENAVLFNAALCCNCAERKAMLAIERGYTMDQGSTIFRPDWVEEGRRAVEVDVVSFDEISKDHLDGEWYMKFDCEGCEYSCLLDIVERHGERIKFIACEFHPPSPVPEYEAKVEELIRSKGIEYTRWH